MIQASDGFYLWSETYDRELNDIFAVQEDIAHAVTAALKVSLLGEKLAPAAAKVGNAESYNAYLRGRYFLARRNKENLEKAVGYFDQAIQLDPGYAKSWVGLGQARSFQISSNYIPVAEGYRKAREAIERALILSPDLGEAHAALGWIKQFHDWDWAGAEACYQQALALEPGNPSVISGAASLNRVLGRLDEAITLYNQALKIDPLDPLVSVNIGFALYKAGRYEEAKAAFYKALELFPERALVHGLLGRVHLAQSHPQEALAEAAKEPHPALRLFGLALAYHALGREKESEASLSELIQKFQDDAQYQIAMVYGFRRDDNQAFEWLERAYAQHDVGLSDIKGNPLLRNLEPDPRYAVLLKKMRLPL